MKTRRESSQMNTMPTAAGKAAASTSAPKARQFIGTNPTKVTKGPNVMANTNVGPAGAPYMQKAPYTNGG